VAPRGQQELIRSWETGMMTVPPWGSRLMQSRLLPPWLDEMVVGA
jgi:hypothetical protein